MTKRIYDLIYAVYFMLIGEDKEYEGAKPDEYEKFAAEMLEQEHEFLTIRGSSPDRF